LSYPGQTTAEAIYIVNYWKKEIRPKISLYEYR
jgi:hypothetical protein